MRSRLALVSLVALALLLPAADAQAAGFVAHLKAPNHHPLANKLWYIKVSATTRSGKPLKAVAWYEFLYSGQRVAFASPTPKTPCDAKQESRPHPYAFRGSYRDGILWPTRSVGFPLTFRVVVKVKGRGVKKLDWKVGVRKSKYKRCTR
jgi:hypothetical protein